MKKKIEKYINSFAVDRTLDIPIDQLLDELIKLKDQGTTHISIEYDYGYCHKVEGMDFNGYMQYEESDEEYQDRLDRQAKEAEENKRKRKESKLREYNRLKNELGL
jgi:hypothetical protein